MEGEEKIEIIHIEETDSTNEEVFRLKDKYPIPFFVLADFQTSGRGRYGRSWVSPKGGLWMTGLFLKKDEYDGFKFMFGSSVVVRDILRNLGIPARIKFPNDVYVKDKKICGILVEEREGLLAVGIGLNVNQSEPPVKNSTSIFILTGKEHDINLLAYNIGKRLMEVDRKTFSEVFREFKEKLDTINKPVIITTDYGVLEGVFMDITEDLNVILRGEVINFVRVERILHLEENYERGY